MTATDSTARVEIAGSRLAAPKAHHIGAVPKDRRIEISIYLRPQGDDPPALNGSIDERRQQLAEHRATAHRENIRAVEEFISAQGLTVIETDPARRLIRAAGSPESMTAAFGAKLAMYEESGQTYHARTGGIAVPQGLHGVIESVLGLDGRPVAHTRIVRPKVAQPGSVEPNRLGALYDFPSGVDGTGVTIALIELGGGFRASDTSKAFKAMGLKAPRVIAVSVDGGTNDQSGSDADGEVALDIQVAGGVAPGAEIAVYFAPNTDSGFADAISQAAHDTTNKPSVISISWGSAESNWQPQAVATMNSVLQEAAALGISVYVAAGDNLATDGVDDGKAHVDFPASSPYAIGCGGSHITVSGKAITQEVVWNDGTSGTGGGISDLFDVPAFQASANLPPSVNGGRKGRGVPDVAGDAAPASGYVVVVDGQTEVVGGTSAVAPLWAGLTALISQKAPKPVGFLPDFLYANVTSNTGLTTQITQGDNKPEGSQIGYGAGLGWNACTGLGRPNGQALFDALTTTATS
jgi:kumamolisin